jgi:hypothetical protein
MRRALAALVGTALVVAAGAGVAVAGAPVELAAVGPTSVTGTDATAVFAVGDRTIRQVRYRDRGTLRYTFTLRSSGALPVRVEGLAPLARQPKLFRYVALTDPDGDRTFEVDTGEPVTVTLEIEMENCESLSARAGSFADQVALDVSRIGFVDERVTLTLPEELHTGSPREAACPRATATSRPPG